LHSATEKAGIKSTTWPQIVATLLRQIWVLNCTANVLNSKVVQNRPENVYHAQILIVFDHNIYTN